MVAYASPLAEKQVLVEFLGFDLMDQLFGRGGFYGLVVVPVFRGPLAPGSPLEVAF